MEEQLTRCEGGTYMHIKQRIPRPEAGTYLTLYSRVGRYSACWYLHCTLHRYRSESFRPAALSTAIYGSMGYGYLLLRWCLPSSGALYFQQSGVSACTPCTPTLTCMRAHAHSRWARLIGPNASDPDMGDSMKTGIWNWKLEMEIGN